MGERDDDGREHGESLADEPSPALASHVAYVEASRLHGEAARREVSVLVARAQTLARNGVDLRNPERLGDFMDDQVIDAVRGATVLECGCGGAQGAAALALIAELTRQLAEVTR